MIHCRELGIKIPDDLSIIGFDDIPLCRYTTPPLSSIRQNRDDLGRSAFYALESQIKQIPISMLLLHAELIERESIGIAPKKQPLLENQP
jgi:DNA-binding LacI/PurR family transcriptional regulator